MHRRGIGVLLGCFVHAGMAHAVDLMTVVEQATAHDADLAQARAGYEAAKQAVPQARAALLPRIDGGWGRGHNRIDAGDAPATSYWQNGWTVNLSQPLFDWTRWRNYQQADWITARGAVEWADARQSTILRAARTYFEVLAAEDELERASAYQAEIASHLEILRRKRSAGEATLTDLREAEAMSEQARLQQTEARNALELQRRAIEQMTGQTFTRLSRLPDTAARPKLEPRDVDSWVAQAREKAYPVQLKQIEWQIAKLEVSKAKGEHYPSVNLTASHMPASAASGFAQATKTTTVMLSVSVPLFAGGGIQAKVKESVALEDKAQSGLVSAARQAEASTRDDFSRFQWALDRLDSLTRLVQVSREALAATKIGYDVGTRTHADVLRAFDALRVSQRDRMRAQYEILTTLLQLKAQTGTLNVGEVARLNAMLVSEASIAMAPQPKQRTEVRPSTPPLPTPPALPPPLPAPPPRKSLQADLAPTPARAPEAKPDGPALVTWIADS
ncbi:TolC family outer membrane protein [Variovorax sp. GT1P44]|uniref:TolC family outer membrane protein n=1 Tax=Variovorax sp. GT1P44 TaxID=3443742 RepID=UPI003F469DD3